MAKQKMKKIELLFPVEEAKAVIDYLQYKGVVELSQSNSDGILNSFDTGQTVSVYDRYYDTATSALKALDKINPQKSSLLSALTDSRTEITFAQYLERSDTASDTISMCYTVNSLYGEISRNESEIARLEALRKGLEPWLGLDVPMKLTGSKYASAFIGTLPQSYTEEALREELAKLLGEEDRYEAECIASEKSLTYLFVLCHNECKDTVYDALRSLGFAYPQDPTKHPPKQRYERYGKEIEKLTAENENNKKVLFELSEKRDDIHFCIDYLTICKSKYEALNKVSYSEKTVYACGFVTENNASVLADELESKYTAAVIISDPGEEDDAPVALENRPFAAAVEPITAMYSPPGKNDVDPNPVMSVFYYLLFGIMLSDAGYGLLMAIGTGIAKFKFKPKGALKKTVDMYFWCGLATVFWGALFGSWFGDLPNVIATQFLGKAPVSAALWFEPVSDPMKLLLFSFLFGIIHLFFGVGISFYSMWKQGNKIGALCDCIPVYLLIIGICPLAVNMIGVMNVPAAFTSVGKWLLLAGAVLIVLTSGRDSKNIVGKLGLGLYGLYNAASGWLGDILSYSRLLALGLCTGVIATVINTLGTIPENPTAKLCLFIPVFIFGHTVNMAINLIGTYVHTNRLQYVEFFGKFYEGGGRTFTPLAADTKFIKFKEEK